MAQIATKRNLVVGAHQGAIFGVTPSHKGLILNIGNEGIEHAALMDPNEATQLGVNIIRMAQQCEAMHMAESQNGQHMKPLPKNILQALNGKKL